MPDHLPTGSAGADWVIIGVAIGAFSDARGAEGGEIRDSMSVRDGADRRFGS